MARKKKNFNVVRVNDENRRAFLPAVDSLSLAVSDICLGVYDAETDTACGVLAAESTDNPQTGYSIAVRHIFVEESCRRLGAGLALVDALLDIAATVEAKAVICCHLETDDEADGISRLFESAEFRRTKERLPVYGFRLSEFTAEKAKPGYKLKSLEEISDREWRDFLKLADKRSAVVNVRSYYDPKCSVFAYSGSDEPEGILLMSHRGDVLFVDRVIIPGQDRPSVLGSLIEYAAAEAGKKYSPGTEIGIVASDNDQEMIIKELTGFKAERIGSFVAHVLQ